MGRNRVTALRSPASDPSLRLAEPGRALVRWLSVRALDTEAGERLLPAVPPHCAVTVADLAQPYAEEWERFARELSCPQEQEDAQRAG
ncbi:hypothetical protein ACWIG5_23275 [Streptomyces lydicus]